MDEAENRDNKIIAFKHPLRSYQNYLKVYQSDFEKLKLKCGDDLDKFEILKDRVKNKVKTFMRVRS